MPPTPMPEFVIDAWDPPEEERNNGDVPRWCEVILEIDDTQTFLTTAAANETYRALDHILRLQQGPRIIDRIWEILDDLTDRLMTGLHDGEPMDEDETLATKFRAEGVACSLAMLMNPMEPNLDAIREQAVERYEAAQEA